MNNNNKNCYLILHLSTSATREEIKKSYRKLANLYHPDKPTGDADRFRIIKDAYDKLMKATPVSKTHQDYNTREMPGPEFVFVGARERNGYCEITVLICNVLKLYTDDGEGSWDVPHNIAYGKNIKEVNLKLGYDQVKIMNHIIKFTILGTNGKEYKTDHSYHIPKQKNRLEKLFNNIW